MRRVLFCLSFLVLSLFALPSLADNTTINKKLIMAEDNPIASVGCKAYKLLTNGITKAIIVLLFIITGLGFFIGKISWGIAISLLIGTSLTLTSGTLVEAFVGDAGKGGGDGNVCECKYGLDTDGNCKSPYKS